MKEILRKEGGGVEGMSEEIWKSGKRKVEMWKDMVGNGEKGGRYDQ